jgi:transcriptional regulator with XRE-family HTH domain
MGADIGTRLKKIRELRNYTQEHMANKLDISQNAYHKLENGTTKLTTDRLEQIAKVLDVPVESILNSEKQVFNLDNNHIDKFYGYIENLHDENKEAWQKTVAILEEQIAYLKEQNSSLLKTIEVISKK